MSYECLACGTIFNETGQTNQEHRNGQCPSCGYEDLKAIEANEENELAYTAGIIDGEGCISLNRNKSQSCKRGYVLQLCVGVTNTSEWLIQWLHCHYGGFTGHQKQRCLRHKDKWVWQIVAKQAQSFLELIFPYLKLKRTQAEVGIRFQEAKYNTGRAGKTDEEIAIEEAQCLIMHNLNRKGRVEYADKK